MCRNIKTLFNFEPPVTDEEIRAASLQFVRKLSGFTRPSKLNEAAFQLAVDQTSDVARTLLRSLVTNALPPRPRGRGRPSAGASRGEIPERGRLLASGAQVSLSASQPSRISRTSFGPGRATLLGPLDGLLQGVSLDDVEASHGLLAREQRGARDGEPAVGVEPHGLRLAARLHPVAADVAIRGDGLK